MQIVSYMYLYVNGRGVPTREAMYTYEVINQYLQTLIVHPREDKLQAEQG